MKIIHNSKDARFETCVENTQAHVQYEINELEKTIDIRHTIVPKAIGGQGIAAKLVEATYAFGKEKGLFPRATCSYARIWLKQKGIEVPTDENTPEGSCAL